MIEYWRELLYPLGFLAQIVFGWRFLQQWLNSELHQKSLVTVNFWRFSLVGNILLLIHSYLQLQFHVCIIQGCNAVISWRNLNLMEQKTKQVRTRTVILILLGLSLCSTLLFLLQGYLFEENFDWLRVPAWGSDVKPAPLFWHVIGIVGLVLFSSRFWIQWWCAEKQARSYLGLPFWWLSFIGAFLSVLYFGYLGDPVNALGPAIGLIPYLRNLMLLSKQVQVEAKGLI
jgi:lipid-A-disaccharide synthase-like uncharacterized protein